MSTIPLTLFLVLAESDDSSLTSSALAASASVAVAEHFSAETSQLFESYPRQGYLFTMAVREKLFYIFQMFERTPHSVFKSR
jgi:hypothetical protein